MADTLAVNRPRTHAKTLGWLLPALVLMFFLTGISGLIYQVLWLRLLSLVFGVTTWAASTVLSSFMAGLALGSFAAGRLADRVTRPLLWYGVAEVMVGGLALATPWALNQVERLYISLYPGLPHTLGVLTLVRFALAFAVLLIPTTLMGATLPIIIKSSLLQAEGLGQRVSLLYATNTAGAIIGTLLAGFYLIGSLGISAAFSVAATINVVVGAAAMMAALVMPRLNDAPGADVSLARDETGVAISDRARKVVLIVFALSGFTSLALEVVWFRVLVLFMNATTYAFTVMLGTVLLGIAVGSYLITPLMQRRWNWLLVLAGVEVALALTTLASLSLLPWAYRLVDWLSPETIDRLRLDAFIVRLLGSELSLMILGSFSAIFPSTLLMGIAFPIGLRLWTLRPREHAHTGARIGLFYSLNMFGAILGSALAGFVLIPWLGSLGSVLLLAELTLLAAIALLVVLPREQRGWARGLGLTGVLGFAALTFTLTDPYAATLDRRYPGETLLWREEGIETTVSVHQRPSGSRVLYLGGLHQANDEPGMVAYHRLIGHLAMAIHPDPQDALVVGLGGGATPGAVSQYGANLDIVELSGSVVRGAEWFSHINYDVLHQPKTHMLVDDGRNYLLLTSKRYDVITADIIQPFHAGAGNLYAVRYYELARNALKDDGIMLQWISKLPEDHYKAIMRTFLHVFPHATLWDQGGIMIGTKQPFVLDRAAFERKLQNPTTREALAAVGITDYQALFNIYWGSAEDMRRYVGEGPLLTDDRPLVEYFLSLPADRPLPDPMQIRAKVGQPKNRLRRIPVHY